MDNEDKLENPPLAAADDVKPPRSKARKFLLSVALVPLLLITGVVVKLMIEGPQGFIDRDHAATEPAKPPPTAAEIIATEFTGAINTTPVEPEQLAQPAASPIPIYSEETREFADASPEPEPETQTESKKKTQRKPASGEKSLSFSFDKSASKVSKNLDHKKVMQLLVKKLENSCSPKVPDKTKSLKAQISLTKSGTIANIKVTPSSAESELAKCLRKKLSGDKALKPKNKAVAQITVHFKLK